MMRLDKGWRHHAVLLVAVFVITVLAGSCTISGSDSTELFTQTGQATDADSGNAAVPGYGGGVVPWEMEVEQVVAVGTIPAVELSPGDGKMTMSVAHVPFSVPDSYHGKSTSALVDGLAYYVSSNATESEVQGVTFDPTVGVAYACYELTATTHSDHTVGFAWYSMPSAMDSYFIGIGDEARGVWHWYAGPDDGVLTFDTADWAGGGSVGARLLVCVVLESGIPADFWQLKTGVTEVRGTGLMYEDSSSLPQSPRTVSSKQASTLPSLVDLRPLAPPISNQGSMGSCSAFGCNDSAFNITLSRMYSQYGWEQDTDPNRTSPMWSYVKSGIPPIGNFNPPCGSSVGRYMSQAFNVLKTPGTATEETVPYYATSNCSTTFPEQADIEAPLLTIDNYYSIPATGIVDSIKQQLADDNAVVIAMYGLESGFLYYSGGVYHYGGTQGVNGGHAMCIVGYDDSLQAFDVRNSWGGSWGVGGYWWCGYDAVEALKPLGRFDAYYLTATSNADAISYFLDGTPPPSYDEVEPNDTIAQANALPGFDFADYSATMDEAEQYDYFSFDYVSGSNSTLTVSYTAAQVQPTVTLRDASDALLATAEGGSGTLTISGVWSSSGTAYLQVLRTSGSGDYTITGSVTLLPPDAPTGISATDGDSDSFVAVSWSASSGATSYQVQRATDEAGSYSAVGTTYGTSYNDYTAELWQEYWYRVLAVNDEGYSLPSAPDIGFLEMPHPANVMATDGDYDNKVEISWTGVSGVEQYIVKRSLTADGYYFIIAQTDVLTLVDTDVQPGKIYHYVVCAVIGSTTGASSDPDSGYAINNAAPAEVADNPGLDSNVVEQANGNNSDGQLVVSQ